MLFKRKNNTNWYYKFTIKGKTVYRSTGTNDKEKAQQIADKVKAQSWDRIILGVKPRYFWEDAVIRYLEQTDKKTIDDDKSILRWLRPYLDGLHLDEISKDTVEKVMLQKLNTGVSKTRVNRTTTVINTILNKACKEWDWIDTVPHIRKYKEPSVRVRWLTKDEASRLVAELPPHLEAMVRFSLLTGLRESNVTLLEWNQIDMQRHVAWIHPDQAKAGKAIGIPLNNEAIEVLKNQIGKHSIRVFIFNGQPVKKAGTRAFKNALSKAGIENFRWHDLRHTWASWHVQNGTPLHVLKELGGWASYEMVQRYAHLAPEHLAKYASNSGQFVAKSVALDNLSKLKKL
jgi:integrase